MLLGILALLGCQLLGEAVVLALGLSVPGPVLGLVILLCALLLMRRVSAQLRQPAEGLLSHLSLLFVPAGVGLVVHFDLLAREWWLLLIALVSSSAITLVVTILALRLVNRWQRGGR